MLCECSKLSNGTVPQTRWGTRPGPCGEPVCSAAVQYRGTAVPTPAKSRAQPPRVPRVHVACPVYLLDLTGGTTLSHIEDKTFVGDVFATTSDGKDNNSSAIPSYCPMAKYPHRIGGNMITMGPTLRKAPLVHQHRRPMANDVTLRIAI